MSRVFSTNLSEMQMKFVMCFLTNGLNATAAVRSAGYKVNEKYTRQFAYYLLKNKNVKIVIDKSLHKLEKKLNVNKEYLLKKLKRVVDEIPDSEHQDLLVDKTNLALKAISEANKMMGNYEAQKIDIKTDRDVEETKKLIEQYRKDY